MIITVRGRFFTGIKTEYKRPFFTISEFLSDIYYSELHSWRLTSFTIERF